MVMFSSVGRLQTSLRGQVTAEHLIGFDLGNALNICGRFL